MTNASTDKTRIGGLTKNEREKFFRLQRQLREAATNVYMRLNDEGARSWKSRTTSARVMAERARDIWNLMRRT